MGYIKFVLFMVFLAFAVPTAKILIWDYFRAKVDDSDYTICCVGGPYKQNRIIISRDSHYGLVKYGPRIFVVDLRNKTIEKLPSRLAEVHLPAPGSEKYYTEERTYSSPYIDAITFPNHLGEIPKSVGFTRDGKSIYAIRHKAPTEILWDMKELGLDYIDTGVNPGANRFSVSSLEGGTLTVIDSADKREHSLDVRLRKHDDWFMSPHGNFLVIRRFSGSYGNPDEAKQIEIWNIPERRRIKESIIYSPHGLIVNPENFTPNNKSLLLLQENGWGDNYVKFIEF